MSNESVMYLKKSISEDQLFTLIKEINDNYFLGHFQIIKLDGGVQVKIISETHSEDSFYFDMSGYGKSPFFPDFSESGKDYVPQPSEIPPFPYNEVKTDICSPHKQSSNFMWFAKFVFEKAILYDYCCQEWAYDSGIGWYKINIEHYLSPSKNKNELQEQIKKLKKNPNQSGWFSYCYNIPKETRKLFCLSEGPSQWDIKRLFGLIKKR